MVSSSKRYWFLIYIPWLSEHKQPFCWAGSGYAELVVGVVIAVVVFVICGVVVIVVVCVAVVIAGAVVVGSEVVFVFVVDSVVGVWHSEQSRSQKYIMNRENMICNWKAVI